MSNESERWFAGPATTDAWRIEILELQREGQFTAAAQCAVQSRLAPEFIYQIMSDEEGRRAFFKRYLEQIPILGSPQQKLAADIWKVKHG